MSVRIVLIEPSHPGNIGAVARAIGNMGTGELWLVRPADHLCEEAKARSAGNDDILINASVCDSLDQAVADCTFVVGTSARVRTVGWPNQTPEDAMADVSRLSSEGQSIAVLFGPERTGLSNHHVERCDLLVRIPVDDRAPSINLAGAALIMLYELRRANEGQTPAAPMEQDSHMATREQIEGLFDHLFHVSNQVGFIAHGPREVLKRKMRRIFLNPGLKENEVNILRGFLTAVSRKLGASSEDSNDR